MEVAVRKKALRLFHASAKLLVSTFSKIYERLVVLRKRAEANSIRAVDKNCLRYFQPLRLMILFVNRRNLRRKQRAKGKPRYGFGTYVRAEVRRLKGGQPMKMTFDSINLARLLLSFLNHLVLDERRASFPYENRVQAYIRHFFFSIFRDYLPRTRGSFNSHSTLFGYVRTFF